MPLVLNLVEKPRLTRAIKLLLILVFVTAGAALLRTALTYGSAPPGGSFVLFWFGSWAWGVTFPWLLIGAFAGPLGALGFFAVIALIIGRIIQKECAFSLAVFALLLIAGAIAIVVSPIGAI